MLVLLKRLDLQEYAHHVTYIIGALLLVMEGRVKGDAEGSHLGICWILSLGMTAIKQRWRNLSLCRYTALRRYL